MKTKRSSRRVKQITRVQRVGCTKSKVMTHFFVRGFLAFLVVLVLVFSLYFFVFPSIFALNQSSRNILIISNKLDVPSKNIYIAHTSENKSKNIVLKINAEQTVLMPEGYGEYPLQSVYQLLLIDKKDRQFVLAVFSELFKIPIDDVVSIDMALNDISETELSSFFLSNIFSKKTILHIDTVTTLASLHYLTKETSVFDIKELEGIEKYYNNLETVTGQLSQYCSVAVINATGVNGRARDVGETIENSGALVVRIDDTKELQEQTKVYYGSSPLDCSQLAHKISGIFSQKPEILPIEQLENAQQYRAKVVVFVGNGGKAGEKF